MKEKRATKRKDKENKKIRMKENIKKQVVYIKE